MIKITVEQRLETLQQVANNFYRAREEVLYLIRGAVVESGSAGMFLADNYIQVSDSFAELDKSLIQAIYKINSFYKDKQNASTPDLC